MINLARCLQIVIAIVAVVTTQSGVRAQDNSSDETKKNDVAVNLERDGLIYGLGHVEQVIDSSALIDLGDAHTVRPDTEMALFRLVSNYYVPVGVIRIAETYPTFCRAERSRRITPEQGDLAIFVREFRNVPTGEQYISEFVKLQMIKKSGANRYSTRRDLDTAAATRSYVANYPEWEQRSSQIVGFLHGASFKDDNHETIDQLIDHISMIREIYGVGITSLPAAGPAWSSVIPVLSGETIVAQHQAARIPVTDPSLSTDRPSPSIREIRNEVERVLFDRQEEEKHLLSFLVATAIQSSPENIDLWLQEKLGRSQFPLLAGEDLILEQLRNILLNLQADF